MGKKKRKVSAAERAAKEKRRQEYETIFIRGKRKRVRRPPTIDGMDVDEFIRANADPIFLTSDDDADLMVGFAVDLVDPGEVASLILQRTPRYEILLPPEERGVSVSHELHWDEDPDMAHHIVVDGSCVDIETRRRTYRLDVSQVAPSETELAREVLRQMHRHGGFTLAIH